MELNLKMMVSGHQNTKSIRFICNFTFLTLTYSLDFYHIMIKLKLFFLLTIIILNTGCEMWPEHEKYKRPDWLPGKLYTTVSVQENLSMFTECLQLAGLDEIIDVSGSWSVFAPTDEAMKEFLSENNYASIYDIPPDELERITKFHVIQTRGHLSSCKLWVCQDGKPERIMHRIPMHLNGLPCYKILLKNTGSREQERKK
jgi:hypothetical protein